MTRYRAAIVGLGQVGLLFDQDAKRRGVWTHFTAYERLPDRFDLVAVCDTDPGARALAVARRPSAQAFASLDEMLAGVAIDVVSLCTPIPVHESQILTCAGRVRAIVCEKPLSADLESGETAAAACAAAGTVLAVNYYKRFEGTVQAAARLLAEGAIGEVRTAAALYSGPLDAVGSHAIDLLQFLLGPLAVTHVTRAGDREGAVLTFGREGVAMLSGTGPREDLVFEIDLIGSEGRLRILENCDRLELSQFSPSPRYGGYRELVTRAVTEASTADRFVPLFVEVAELLDGARGRLTSDGATALSTQQVVDRMRHDAVQR
jgi:predicted dehydrogenase